MHSIPSILTLQSKNMDLKIIGNYHIIFLLLPPKPPVGAESIAFRLKTTPRVLVTFCSSDFVIKTSQFLFIVLTIHQALGMCNHPKLLKLTSSLFRTSLHHLLLSAAPQ